MATLNGTEVRLLGQNILVIGRTILQAVRREHQVVLNLDATERARAFGGGVEVGRIEIELTAVIKQAFAEDNDGCPVIDHSHSDRSFTFSWVGVQENLFV